MPTTFAVGGDEEASTSERLQVANAFLSGLAPWLRTFPAKHAFSAYRVTRRAGDNITVINEDEDARAMEDGVIGIVVQVLQNRDNGGPSVALPPMWRRDP